MTPASAKALTDVGSLARRAKQAARLLATLGTQRDAALRAMADALERRSADVLAANGADVARARGEVEAGRLSDALLHRLHLTPQKLGDLVAGLRQLAAAPDPVGRVTLATELDDGLLLERVTCPIGVVGVVFEARPDALPQIAGLCLKAGNAVMLKGGREAERSNRALAAILQEAVAGADVPADAITLLATREDVSALLGADGDVDLIVPRGSAALVRHIQEHTRIPVLGHADGLCHVYVDAAANLEIAHAVVVDAKVQYPAACNAVETLLVHDAAADAFLPRIGRTLVERGVELRADPGAARRLSGVPFVNATDDDWTAEYNDLVLAVRVVPSLDEAIRHINVCGSRHTEAIVTDDDAAWARFFAEVDAAGVYRNVSTRFADGYRYGFGAEVGISTGTLHPRGPVGLDGLVTYKYRLTGAGHIVAVYGGPHGRALRHRDRTPPSP
jgi:glutamate-5-semialdehyde dehydrogenase